MRLRRVILVVLLVGGFWYLTTHLSSHLGHFSLLNAHSTSSPLELTEAQAAPAFDAEEVNNISVYKKVLPSVVNITSTTLVFNFFYGTVPQQGQGSGFILDKAGHVLTNYHVVEGANRGGIEVMLSNKKPYKATVVGEDREAFYPERRVGRHAPSRTHAAAFGFDAVVARPGSSLPEVRL